MISEGRYKNQKAIIVENENLSMSFLPDTGANLASVVLKEENFEFMVQRPEREYRRVEFGGDYVEAECSGMDDMFPTIDRCYYERFPWSGTELADHGEVWNLAADVNVKGDDRVDFTFHGVRLPYVFHKNVSIIEKNTVRIDYSAENNTDFEMDFLWAGHTMLQAEPGTRVIVPEDCICAQAVFTDSGRIGAYGEEFDYPVYREKDGSLRDMSVMGERQKDSEKYYLKYPLTEGMCGIERTNGRSFTYRFPADRVPYLGLLQNFGGFREMYNMFLEPCTSPFDRPDVARLMKKNCVIPPRSAYDWYLEITVR